MNDFLRDARGPLPRLLALPILLATASLAHAQVATPRWDRPTTTADAAANRTTYQAFDLFWDDDGDAGNGILMGTPDAANINPNGNATLAETGGQSFLTSTGNIYSPFAVVEMVVTVPTYTPANDTVTRFLLQVQTQGSELVRTSAGDPTATPPVPPTFDFDSFIVNGTPLSQLVEFDYRELSRLPNTGQLVQHAFEFAVRRPATGDFAISYSPLGTSSSQQYVSIDTFTTVLGDFDFDGDRDSADIDLLLRSQVGATPPSLSLFDLNEDRSVGATPNAASSDADAWVRTLEGTNYGDADLNGQVNFDDLLVLAKGYGQPGVWASGDFNGSDAVDFDDLLLLASAYGFNASVSVGAFEADWALAQSIVPEPSACLALAAAAGLVGRRRRA